MPSGSSGLPQRHRLGITRGQLVEATFDRDLENAPDDTWAADLDQLVFRGSAMLDEIVFFHRRTRSVSFADLVQNFERERLTFVKRILMRLGGSVDPDGKAPLYLRLTFLGHHDVARECFGKTVTWAPEQVLVAHGRCYAHDGVTELRRAFRGIE